jgi:hypothetical protein
MRNGADILSRVAKAGLLVLACLIASVALVPSASAHGMHHHPSMHPPTHAPAADAPAPAAPAAAALAFVSGGRPDAGCAGGGHDPGHPGCCAGDHCCSAACAAAALPQVADLPVPASSPSIIAAARRSNGVATTPGEDPPRPIL